MQTSECDATCTSDTHLTISLHEKLEDRRDKYSAKGIQSCHASAHQTSQLPSDLPSQLKKSGWRTCLCKQNAFIRFKLEADDEGFRSPVVPQNPQHLGDLQLQNHTPLYISRLYQHLGRCMYQHPQPALWRSLAPLVVPAHARAVSCGHATFAPMHRQSCAPKHPLGASTPSLPPA